MNSITTENQVTGDGSQKKVTLEVGKLRFAALLAALANASHAQAILPRYFFAQKGVELALDRFRSTVNPMASIASPDFIKSFLQGAPVVVIESSGDRPTLIDVSIYDKANGEGLAKEVVDRILRNGNVDTRDLCRYERIPASMWSILLVLGAITLGLVLLMKIGTALKH